MCKLNKQDLMMIHTKIEIKKTAYVSGLFL